MLNSKEVSVKQSHKLTTHVGANTTVKTKTIFELEYKIQTLQIC